MKKLYANKYIIYMYVIPAGAVLGYIVWLILSCNTNFNIKLLQESNGFGELCKALLNYTSILLGVYGFFVPIIIGKMKEDFSAKFWRIINKNNFAKDNHRIFFAGIMTILLSAILLLKDIMNIWVINILVILLIWNLLFFSCSIYRFIGIFIRLIIGGKNQDKKDKYQIHDSITEAEKVELEENIDPF